jgi:CBS-domain-containing membrane protein
MDVTEATKLMVDNGVRRLPIVDGDKLTGIVTLDDLAVRIGDLEIAASITAQVTRAPAGLLLLRPRRLRAGRPRALTALRAYCVTEGTSQRRSGAGGVPGALALVGLVHER